MNRIAELRRLYRIKQGSLNYWNNAARAARVDVERHDGRRQENDRRRLAEFEKKALAAHEALELVKAQLNELDPEGVKARQANALRSAIARAHREMQHFEVLAGSAGTAEIRQYYDKKIDARRVKLAELEEALSGLKDQAERLAQDKLDLVEHMAIVNKAYRPNPLAEQLKTDAIPAFGTDAPALSELTPDDRQALIAALITGIDDAERRNDLAGAERLAVALEYQLELSDDPPDGTRPAH